MKDYTGKLKDYAEPYGVKQRGKPKIAVGCRGPGGFFHRATGKNAGFSEKSHVPNVREGHWARRSRGIYRLTLFPAVLRPELLRWHLWPMRRTGQAQGVYRHSIALGLYGTPRIKPSDVAQMQLEALLVWKKR
ncbi:MAG: hypothetical protein WBF45_08995 [Acidobacteriaceae bacterium]